MFNCINSKASWNTPLLVSNGAKEELRFWRSQIRALNGRPLQETFQFAHNIYSDASGVGYGGFIEEQEGSQVTGTWSQVESGKSSTWRELEAVNRTLHSLKNSLEGHCVQWHTDNKNVVGIIQKGSKKPELQTTAIEIHTVCVRYNINVVPVWVPRESNQIADALSRYSDSDDWMVDMTIFSRLHNAWGPYTIDRFAADYNNQCERFNSKWWCPGTSGIDAFMQPWGTDCNWWVPPPSLISRTVDKLVKEKARGTLVIPQWKSATFWPKIHNGNIFRPFVSDYKSLHANVLHKGRGNNGIFGSKSSNFMRIAVNITI